MMQRRLPFWLKHLAIFHSLLFLPPTLHLTREIPRQSNGSLIHVPGH